MPKPYSVSDPYTFRAQKEGYRARSVYKLEELDMKFKLFRPGQNVIDAGAAPGSWLQYVSKKIAPGMVLGLDLKEIEPVAENVITQVADINNLELVDRLVQDIGWEKVDLVISDLAPNTSGIKYLDQALSIEMSRSTAELAKRYLKPEGKLVMKIFKGEHFDQFMRDLTKVFKRVEWMSVKASRDRSREIYVVCSNLA